MKRKLDSRQKSKPNAPDEATFGSAQRKPALHSSSVAIFTRIVLPCAIALAMFAPASLAQNAASARGVAAAPVLTMVASTAAGANAQAGGEQPTLPPERMVSVFGKTIHYWDLGSGPVVVLLHGLGDRKESWARVAPELAKNHRVLAPDQIGFGKSDKPLLDYSVQTYVDFLDEFLRQLNVQKASLVGESLGGWIAALYAVESGTGAKIVPVEKLVLVDAAGLQQHKAIPDLNPSTLESMRHVMQVVFYDTSWLDDATLRRIFTDKLAENDGYTVHAIMTNPRLDSERLDDRLGNIKVPTLVVWGKQDQLLPLESGQRYASGIAGARLVAYDNCGHVPPAEHTAEFVKAVGEFLQ